MEPRHRTVVFDYQVTRFVIGMIALTLPFVVSIVSAGPLSSISASYFTCARDIFVGMLFVVGAFLLAYNGYTTPQSVASKVGSLAAILIALCPTNCDTCALTPVSFVHYCSATILFSVLAFFCLGPFRKKAKEKDTRKARRRITVYLICGTVMIVCMLSVAISKALPPAVAVSLRVTYWAEAVALVAFGISWLTAAKVLPVLADSDELLRFFRKISKD
jgi:hypothetical protein